MLCSQSTSLSLANAPSIDLNCLRPRANHSAVIHNKSSSKFLQLHSLGQENDNNHETSDTMIIFGGNNEETYFNDMFSINLDNLTMKSIFTSTRSTLVFPRIKHTAMILRGEKILIFGGSLNYSYGIDKTNVAKGFFMNVMGTVAPRASIDATLIAGATKNTFVDLVYEFDLFSSEEEKKYPFGDISHHTTCAISPSSFILVGGQFNTEKKTATSKNDKIWLFSLKDVEEVLRRVETEEDYVNFGNLFHKRMQDTFGDYIPIGCDIKVNVLNEKTFYVHKFMLSRFSYFREMIEKMDEQDTHSSYDHGEKIPELNLSSLSVDTFSHIVDYLYGIDPPIFNNREEMVRLNTFCEKHNMTSICNYIHGKMYQNGEDDYLLPTPAKQLIAFLRDVFNEKYPELYKYFTATIRLIFTNAEEEEQKLSQVEDLENQPHSRAIHDIQVPMPILVTNDFFHACVRDLWLKKRHQHEMGELDHHGDTRNNNQEQFLIEIDNTIFPYLDEQYIPTVEEYIATLYGVDARIHAPEDDTLIAKLIQLYLVSNVFSDTKMENEIISRCKKRISFENAFQLLCFAHQHPSPNDVFFIYKECIRVLKDVLPVQDVDKIVQLLHLEISQDESL